MFSYLMAKRGYTTAERNRTDGRKSFLVYLPKDLIQRLKTAAIKQDRHAYELTEEAVRHYLATQRHRRPGST